MRRTDAGMSCSLRSKRNSLTVKSVMRPGPGGNPCFGGGVLS